MDRVKFREYKRLRSSSDALHQYLVAMRFAVMMNDEPALIRNR